MTTLHATGRFDVTMTPRPGEFDGSVSRFDFEKRFDRDLVGTSTGLILSCGDPQSGNAGYVVLEVVAGRIGDHEGTFALQQLGQLRAGNHSLTYEVASGSGTGPLTGIQGRLDLTITDGDHRYDLQYTL